MNYFQAEHISKSFGEKALFDDLSFSISQGDKLAFIARNGNGKSTLLNIIAGLDTADSGVCSYKNDLRIAYLQQDPLFDPQMKVSEALLHADNELTRVIREYEDFMLAESHDTARDSKQLQKLMERMDAMNAWGFEHRIKQLVSLFKVGALNARVGELSGGQQKRLALARILLDEADMVLLDEPTNHLDLDMIEWMEGALGKKKTTLLIVTHDRYFLDAVCNGILELEQGTLYNHRGNYSYYLQKKQERLAARESSSEKASNLLRKETEWMRRSPQARTTKSKARIDAFYDLEEKASLLKEGSMDTIRMQMSRLGKKILELSHVTKQFDGNTFIDDFSYVFKRGDRIGIAGPNGIGKSTLLNIITEQIQPDQGKVTKGETIQFGYYRQAGLQADESKRVLEVITDIADHMEMDGKRLLSASQLLHHFNFDHAAQYGWVSKLSGGEKRRLYLLTVLMRNPNFLILDEPTNDFDIETLNILEGFLADFNGCLLIVSHDRYFLDNLVDQLFIFEGQGKIKGFVGNYSAYRENKKQDDAKQPVQKTTVQVSQTAEPREKVKLSYKEQKEYEALEKDIALLEAEKEQLIETLNMGQLSADELMKASQRYSQVETELNKKGDRWLELSEWA